MADETAYSIGEQVVQALADALNAPTNKPYTTWRTRVDAFASSELPAAVLYAVDEEPEYMAPEVVKRTRSVRLELIVTGEPPADRAVDPLYVYAVKTLYADDNLGNLIRGLREARIQWETEASYEDACIAAVDFKVIFSTKATDPTVQTR